MSKPLSSVGAVVGNHAFGIRAEYAGTQSPWVRSPGRSGFS